jgi:hypothetical protein
MRQVCVTNLDDIHKLLVFKCSIEIDDIGVVEPSVDADLPLHIPPVNEYDHLVRTRSEPKHCIHANHALGFTPKEDTHCMTLLSSCLLYTFNAIFILRTKGGDGEASEAHRLA